MTLVWYGLGVLGLFKAGSLAAAFLRTDRGRARAALSLSFVTTVVTPILVFLFAEDAWLDTVVRAAFVAPLVSLGPLVVVTRRALAEEDDVPAETIDAYVLARASLALVRATVVEALLLVATGMLALFEWRSA